MGKKSEPRGSGRSLPEHFAAPQQAPPIFHARSSAPPHPRFENCIEPLPSARPCPFLLLATSLSPVSHSRPFPALLSSPLSSVPPSIGPASRRSCFVLSSQLLPLLHWLCPFSRPLRVGLKWAVLGAWLDKSLLWPAIWAARGGALNTVQTLHSDLQALKAPVSCSA